jgi:hemoglobin
MFGRMTAVAAVLCFAVSVSGCNTTGGSGAAMAQEKSLYDRLGGKSAITAVVDDFVGRVAADTRINGKFANANIPRLKTMLVDQICQASGGPCTYTGRDMKSAHAGMGVSGSEFDALVGDLVATLTKFKVGEREKNELLGALGPMKKDIVERPTAMAPSMESRSAHQAALADQDYRASLAF